MAQRGLLGLPGRALNAVLSHADSASLCAVARCCRALYAAAAAPDLWRRLIGRELRVQLARPHQAQRPRELFQRLRQCLTREPCCAQQPRPLLGVGWGCPRPSPRVCTTTWDL